MVYELEVKLINVGIPVRRTIQIDENATFYDLHIALQAAFEWEDSHLHSFFVIRQNGAETEPIEISLDEKEQAAFPSIKNKDSYVETEEKLSNWFKVENDEVLYVYDFGDDWAHEIKLNRILPVEKGTFYPRCIDALHLAPPENSRGQIIFGEINLHYEDSKNLVKEINDNIKIWFDDSDDEIDYWYDTLKVAKQYHAIKPWNVMYDDHIFGVYDPVSSQYLFCSVIGNMGEIHGLAVYVGMDGFFALIDTLTSGRDEFDILQRQHGLLISFEDRLDLTKEEYKLIKSYDISFRGKKAWPSFVSYKPGYYPWQMNNEEARLMILALEEAMNVCEEMKTGLQLPDILKDEQLLIRANNHPNAQSENTSFIIDLEDIFANDTRLELTISELEIKRISKIKKILPVTIEFSLNYVNMPIEVTQGERPIFPLAVIVADYDESIIIHHQLYEEQINCHIAQREFVNILHNFNGIPNTILTDDRTYYYIVPLLEELNITVEIAERLPTTEELLQGLQSAIQLRK